MPDSGWLDALTLESFAKIKLPVQEILEGSVYYPASGTDGSPVRHWWLDARSFVYADISASEASYIQASQERPFKGYRVWGRRRVELIELTSARASFAPPPSLELSAYHRTLEPLHGYEGEEFSLWTVYERTSGFGDEHGPKRFSMLHLRAEGAASYQALYIGRRLLPQAVCNVRPGTAFGGNYSNFEQVFFETLKMHPAGLPPYLIAWHLQGQPELSQPWSEAYSGMPVQTGNKDGEVAYKLSLYGLISPQSDHT